MYQIPITNVETDENVVALTFDDGPDPIYTPQVLKILNKYKAKATFFLVGEAAKKYPDLVRSIAENGHEIGNHAWNHLNLTSVRSRFRRIKQLWKCSRAIAPYGSRVFRPPYGAHNKQVQYDAGLLRYKLILWNVSAQDWVPQGSDEIANKIIDRCASGNIFLLHDSIFRSHLSEAETLTDRTPMIVGLDKALATLCDQFQFLTVTEVLNSGKPVCNWPIKNMP